MIVDPERAWRLDNLYSIVNKSGRKVPFRMNWAQQALLADMHSMNCILKARQLGFSSFIQLIMLDACLFNSNIRCGTIAHTLVDAQTIFRDKVKFPYDNLPDDLKARAPLLSSNTSELLFSNNSSIRVGTSMRGSSLQYLHVSEYGALCARFPERAREVRTGALNTLQAGNTCFIESTAQGMEGHFYEICQTAQSNQRMGVELTPLDFRFHFYPWWKEAGYTLPVRGAPIPAEYERYFSALDEVHGIALSAEQKQWYSRKAATQLADMRREFPSTPEEAFESSVEGAFYASQIARAELEERIGHYPADPMLPVHSSWDLGIGDATSLWFWQITPERRRLVGFYEASGEAMPHFIEVMNRMAREKGWTLGDAWLPHDSMAREWTSGRTRFEQFREATKRFPKLVPQESVEDGINAARLIFARCEFDEQACSEGLKALRNYRKEWSEEAGCWRDRPRHDWSSHAADSFRYFSLAIRDARPIALPEPPRRYFAVPAFHLEATGDGRMVGNFTVNDVIARRTRSRLEREFG
jgi:hypothetical protein